jgi:hypothetical protein
MCRDLWSLTFPNGRQQLIVQNEAIRLYACNYHKMLLKYSRRKPYQLTGQRAQLEAADTPGQRGRHIKFNNWLISFRKANRQPDSQAVAAPPLRN